MALFERLFLLLLLLQLSLTIALRVDNVAKNESKSEPAYRVSRPENRQPVKRVPQHLQDIRPGFVDDDAGDVIRIIEPPQHFQQLKRLRQRQQQHPQTQQAAAAASAPVVWEQPRKLSTNRGAPQLPQHRPKINFKSANADLLTQETQNSLQFPMEILASVRKTERLLQRQRKKQPLVRQRHIQRQSHTLIAQKALEQQLYQRGQQHRLRAALAQEHKRSKRVKRDLNTTSKYNVAQGLKLVARIDELLQNATRYLPDEPETKETTTLATKIGTTTNATNCDNKRRSRQRLLKQLGARKTTERRGRNFRHEATTTTTTTKATITKSKNSTSSVTTSATPQPLASRLVNSRKSPNNRNHLKQLASSRRDDSVLYADVMSNIRRNSWQEHDTPPQQQQHQNNSDYRELDVYLRELDAIAKKLPSASPITSIKGGTPTKTPNWYLINNEGKIYETQLDNRTKPASTLFHLFPDMPQTNNPISTLDLE